MNKSRLRKAEAILLKLRAIAAPGRSNVIIYTGKADLERQSAALRDEGVMGMVICLPAKKPVPN